MCCTLRMKTVGKLQESEISQSQAEKPLLRLLEVLRAVRVLGTESRAELSEPWRSRGRTVFHRYKVSICKMKGPEDGQCGYTTQTQKDHWAAHLKWLLRGILCIHVIMFILYQMNINWRSAIRQIPCYTVCVHSCLCYITRDSCVGYRMRKLRREDLQEPFQGPALVSPLHSQCAQSFKDALRGTTKDSQLPKRALSPVKEAPPCIKQQQIQRFIAGQGTGNHRLWRAQGTEQKEGRKGK